MILDAFNFVKKKGAVEMATEVDPLKTKIPRPIVDVFPQYSLKIRAKREFFQVPIQTRDKAHEIIVKALAFRWLLKVRVLNCGNYTGTEISFSLFSPIPMRHFTSS